jgi:hypothetical protein
MPDRSPGHGPRRIGVIANPYEANTIDNLLRRMSANLQNILIPDSSRLDLTTGLAKFCTDNRNPHVIVIVKPPYFYRDFNTNNGSELRLNMGMLANFAFNTNKSILIVDRIRQNYNRDSPISNSNNAGDMMDLLAPVMLVSSDGDDAVGLNFERTAGPSIKPITAEIVHAENGGLRLEWDEQAEPVRKKPGPLPETAFRHAMFLVEIMVKNNYTMLYKDIKDEFIKSGFIGRFNPETNEWTNEPAIFDAKNLVTATMGYKFISTKDDSVKGTWTSRRLTRWTMVPVQADPGVLPIR